MRIIENIKLDKSCFEISTLGDENKENGWLLKTPAERIQGLEILRQMWHKYDPDAARLPRIYTVIEQ